MKRPTKRFIKAFLKRVVSGGRKPTRANYLKTLHERMSDTSDEEVEYKIVPDRTPEDMLEEVIDRLDRMESALNRIEVKP